MQEEPAVVLDIGCGTCKVGIAGKAKGCQSFEAVVGRPRHKGLSGYYFGDEARSKRGILNLTRPLQRGGVVADWDGMEQMLRHALVRELRVEPAERPVLMTEGPLVSVSDRERMAQVMFETFSTPSLCFASQAVLCLLASSRAGARCDGGTTSASNTGLVVDMGEMGVHAVPVHDGHALAPHCVRGSEVGGHKVVDYLIQLLEEAGYSFATSAERYIACDIKETMCFVALDAQHKVDTATLQRLAASPTKSFLGCLPRELMTQVNRVLKANTTYEEKYYEVPSYFGYWIQGHQQFRAPEALFQPSLVGSDSPGVHQAAFQSVASCDATIQRDLLANVVLAGGTSLFKGMADRLHMELTRLVCSSSSLQPARHPNVINVVAHPERRNLAWNGGSIMATDPSFGHRWTSRNEYHECGASIVHERADKRI